MSKLTYSEFVYLSERGDKGINDIVHFWSSKFRSPVAYFMYRLGFTPNLATSAFCCVGILSAIFFYTENFLLGYLAFRLHIIIDMADGSIARATKTFSEYADGFDKCSHVLVNTMVVLALTKDVSDVLTIPLTATFLVTYLFGSLFKNSPKGVNTSFDTVPKVILKNMLGFEGFIVLFCCAHLFLPEFLGELTLFYTVVFIIVAAAKLHNMVNK